MFLLCELSTVTRQLAYGSARELRVYWRQNSNKKLDVLLGIWLGQLRAVSEGIESRAPVVEARKL